MRRINFDKGCDDGGNANSYEQSLQGAQGIQGKQGIQGVDGKSSVINGSVTDGTDDSNGTADDALSVTAVTNLNTMGFDVETDSSLLATVEVSDTVNKKTWVRLSNKLFNLIGLEVQPKLLPTSGSLGNVLTSNGTIWISATPVNEIYNSTSVTSQAISSSLIGDTVALTVSSSLLAYRYGQPIRATDIGSNNNYIEGVVLSYTGTSLSFICTNVIGTGTPASWKVSLGALLNVPYVDSSVNGQVLSNNGVIPQWTASSFVTGSCMPWHNEIAPNGWLPCNGQPLTTSGNDYLIPLYNHLRPSGVTNAYAYAWNDYGGVLYGPGEFRLPNYNRDAIPLGKSDPALIGRQFGANSHVLTATELPVASPWTATLVSSNSDPVNTPLITTPNLLSLNNEAGTGGSGSVAKTTAFVAGSVIINNQGGGLGGTAMDLKQLSEGTQWIIKY